MRLTRPELLAQLLAFAEVAEQRIGQKRLRLAIVGPLELRVLASRHVLDQVFHPEQCVCDDFSSSGVPSLERRLQEESQGSGFMPVWRPQSPRRYIVRFKLPRQTEKAKTVKP